MVKMIVSSLVLSILIGCQPMPREQLADMGMFGEKQLKRIESFGAIKGSVGGSFFLGMGSISGSLGSEFQLQFYWEPRPNEIVISSLPYSKFRFIIDEKKEVPIIEFVFDPHWLNTNRNDRVYRAGEKLNPNNFIMKGYYLQIARVYISSAQFEKEVYLPKLK